MFPFVFSREENLRTCPGRQPRGSKETGKEAGKTTGEPASGSAKMDSLLTTVLKDLVTFFF